MRRVFRRPRRPGVVLAVLAVVAGVVSFGVGPASAVHDETFQLEGDVVASTTTSVGGTTQTLDWDSLFDADGNEKPLPAGFTGSVFSRDFQTNANGSFNTADLNTFTEGSKDDLPISLWSCTPTNNETDKIDLMNAYAASYTAPNGDEFLYFGQERNDNTGTANVGFWFLQNGAACAGANSFTGTHADGDLLIVSEYSNGGSVATIKVYRWDGGANGTLNTTAVASGADCEATGANDTVCGTVNGTNNGTAGTISTPWLTANKDDGAGHSLRTREFFEAGLNLTAAGLGGHCFTSYLADTRSSDAIDSALHDFSLGQLGECTTDVVTTPTPSGTVTIPASGTLSTSDSAEVNVEGIDDPFDATLKFFLCGPLGLNTTSTCDAGGVQIGSTQTITAGGTYPSSTATVTSAGRYCWRAEFSGDPDLGVPPGSDSSLSECFTVNPRQPTLKTNAGAGPVNFGLPVTDTATIGNTANQPGTGGLGNGSINPTTPGAKAGGTISFTLFKDDCVTPATGTGGPFPLTVTVNGDGTYGPVSFTPDAPGEYHWVATYSGNLPNTLASLAADSVCGADPDEDVVVRQIATSIATTQSMFPNDTHTVTSSKAGDILPATGTVTFKLYQAAGGNSAAVNCQTNGATGLLYTQTVNNVGGAHSVTTSTTNTTVAVNTNGSYFWSVVYDPGDAQHVGRQNLCTENTAVNFTNDTGPGTQFP